MTWHIIRPFNYQLTLTISQKAQKDSHLSKEPHANKQGREWEEIVFLREEHTDCYTLSYVNPKKTWITLNIHIYVCVYSGKCIHTYVY